MGTLGRKAVWGAVVALSVLIPAASASASGNLLNVDQLLQGVSSESPRQVIVRIRPEARDRVKERLPNRGRGISKDPLAATPTDEYGHGTHVAGLIGSSGASSNGKYAGIAPGIKCLGLRVLDRKGAGKTSNVICALEFAACGGPPRTRRQWQAPSPRTH